MLPAGYRISNLLSFEKKHWFNSNLFFLDIFKTFDLVSKQFQYIVVQENILGFFEPGPEIKIDFQST